MTDLQTALTLLQGKYGELDNVKFCLGDTDGMTPQAVEAEILRVAEGISSGKFAPQASFPESRLEKSKIVI